MFVYPKDTGEKLEFDQILMAISGYARLKSAKELSQVLRPYKSYDEAKRALLETGEMLQSYVQGLSFPDISCPEVGKEILLLKLDGSVLDEKQCLAILAMLEAANGFIRFMRDKKTIFPTLSALCEFLEEEKQLPATILSIIDEHGLVRSSASPQLASIRKELQTKRRENERIFQSILSKLRKAGVLADIEELSLIHI